MELQYAWLSYTCYQASEKWNHSHFMSTEFLYDYINSHKLAVIATVNEDGDPESAVIGIAVTKELEIIFDTVRSSRKYHNLLKRPRASFVIGWDDESTIQYEGTAIPLDGEDG